MKKFSLAALWLTPIAIVVSSASFAQSDPPPSAALLTFLDKAAVHITLSNEVKKQCPAAKFEVDFESNFKTGLESSPLLQLVLDSKIKHSATQAEGSVSALLEKFGGCSSPSFEKLEHGMSIFSGKLLAQWIAQDF